jgi:hypothetical protein
MSKTFKALVMAAVFGLAMAAGSASAVDNQSAWFPSGTTNQKFNAGGFQTALSVDFFAATWSINDTINTWHYAQAFCVSGGTSNQVFSGWVFGFGPAWATAACPAGSSNTFGRGSIWT